MQVSPTDFAALIRALNAAGARYLVIGGIAMVAHGSAHITDDVDLLYHRSNENYEALGTVLGTLSPELRGATGGLPFVLDTTTFRNTINMTLTTSVGSIDLLADVPGAATFEELEGRSETVTIFGVATRVVGLDDLIEMKRATGRNKDKLHLMDLLALRDLKNKAGG